MAPLRGGQARPGQTRPWPSLLLLMPVLLCRGGDGHVTSCRAWARRSVLEQRAESRRGEVSSGGDDERMFREALQGSVPRFHYVQLHDGTAALVSARGRRYLGWQARPGLEAGTQALWARWHGTCTKVHLVHTLEAVATGRKVNTGRSSHCTPRLVPTRHTRLHGRRLG